MKLYTYPTAPNPRRVHLYLAEKGIELPCETVDIMTRANRQPEFLEKVNKLGGLPVLELDDGTHIAESVAICRYLEALHPEPPLFGTTAEEQGRIEMWSRRIELNLMRPVGMVWVHGSPLTRGVVKHQIPEAAEQNRSLVREFHRFLDRELASRAFIAGPEFTIADILALTTIDFASKLVELPVDPALEHVAAWHANLSARPSVAANP
ncbi:MAG: glutathione S-transferase family protein [Myxococcota bacterium]